MYILYHRIKVAVHVYHYDDIQNFILYMGDTSPDLSKVCNRQNSNSVMDTREMASGDISN